MGDIEEKKEMERDVSTVSQNQRDLARKGCAQCGVTWICLANPMYCALNPYVTFSANPPPGDAEAPHTRRYNEGDE